MGRRQGCVEHVWRVAVVELTGVGAAVGLACDRCGGEAWQVDDGLCGRTVGAVADWTCEAYGPEGAAVGARCFFAPANERDCGTEVVCQARMVAERQRVFRRINEQAAAGDPGMAYLAEAFPDPSGLLNADPSTEG